MFSPAHYSLYCLCSQESERKNSFLFFLFFFSFNCNKYNQDIHWQKNENRVIHLYTGTLLSHESEQKNAIDSSVEGQSDYHTQ